MDPGGDAPPPAGAPFFFCILSSRIVNLAAVFRFELDFLFYSFIFSFISFSCISFSFISFSSTLIACCFFANMYFLTLESQGCRKAFQHASLSGGGNAHLFVSLLLLFYMYLVLFLGTLLQRFNVDLPHTLGVGPCFSCSMPAALSPIVL